MLRLNRTSVAALGFVLLATACGGDGDPVVGGSGAASEDPSDEMSEGMSDDMSEHSDDDMGDMDGMGSAAVGEPADAADADRTVAVTLSNAFAFDPADFEVAAGEVVTFEITNTGDIEHEFVLGDQAMQDAMGAEMDDMGDEAGHHEGGNAVHVEPGETVTLTWRFGPSGQVLIGCHIPGHYEGGMRGTVTVT